MIRKGSRFPVSRSAVLALLLCASPAGAAVPASVPALPPGPIGIALPDEHDGARSFLAALARSGRAHVRLASGGTLAIALGELAPARPGRPDDAARAFLSERLGLADAAALVVDRDLESDGVRHLTFHHRCDGLPVLGEEVVVHVDSRNAVTGVSGAYRPRTGTAPAATIAAADAIARACAAVGAIDLRAPATARRMWLPCDDRLRAVFLVSVPAARPLGDFAVAVDAASGAILGGADRLRTAATGQVYPHSPLDGTLVMETLADLSAGDRLEGAYVKVVNAKTAGAIAADGRFVYAPDDTHFSEVAVYRNLEKIHAFFRGFGFTGRDRPMKATVHYGDAYDNAFYSPSTDAMAFGDGNRLNNLALEDNVAFHEYTHAVAHLITDLDGDEAGAMDEAFADYFACTLTGSSKLGVWAVAKLSRPWLRNLENRAHYPEDIQHEVHKDGEIWGGALWDLRAALGATVADRLVFKSLYYVGNGPDFRKGVEALLAADRELFSAAHAAAIGRVFRARGIPTALTDR